MRPSSCKAKPRQHVEADARFKGGLHEAQPLQSIRIEQTIAASSALHRPQQAISHDMHTHPGIKG